MAKAPEYYGYNPPFFGGHQNVLSKQSGDRIIKNDLRQLLLTGIGERVMRPNWGTILAKSLFEPMTDDLLTRIRSNINGVIVEYEPRVSADVNVTFDPGRNMIRVSVNGVYTDNPRKRLEFEVDIPVPKQE